MSTEKRLLDFDAWARADPFTREAHAPLLADDMQLTRSQADLYASALIWLCIKSSICPCRMLKIISRRSDYDCCMNGTAVPLPGDEKAVELFKNKGRVIGCAGCPLSDAIEHRREDFINWIVHNPFNPRIDMPAYMYPRDKKPDIEEYYLMKFQRKTVNYNELFNEAMQNKKESIDYALQLNFTEYMDLRRDNYLHAEWSVPVSFLDSLRAEKNYPVLLISAEYGGKESFPPVPVWCVFTDNEGLYFDCDLTANHQRCKVFLTTDRKMAIKCIKMYDLVVNKDFLQDK